MIVLFRLRIAKLSPLAIAKEHYERLVSSLMEDDMPKPNPLIFRPKTFLRACAKPESEVYSLC
jgi:hypothetical protein